MSVNLSSEKGVIGQIWDDISDKFRRFKRDHYADCASFTDLTGLEWQPANHYSGGTEGFTYVTYQTSVGMTRDAAKKLIEIMNAHLVLDRHEHGFPTKNIFLTNSAYDIKLVIYPGTYKALVRRPEFDAAGLKKECLAFMQSLQNDTAALKIMSLSAYPS